MSETDTQLTALGAGGLMECRMRGMLAHMFDVRGVQPTEEEWDLLQGDQAITTRDVGEIAYKLGFEIEIGFKDRTYYELSEDAE